MFFVVFLIVVYVSPDGLCDDGRCKDDIHITALLEERKKESQAVKNEIELVRDLLQICQTLPEHLKGISNVFVSSLSIIFL